MVAETLVPAAEANGLEFERLQPIPAGPPTIKQLKGIMPVNPFTPFTTMVSVIFVPTLVAMMGVFRVTVKSFIESVTLLERVRLLSAALTPDMVTLVFT